MIQKQTDSATVRGPPGPTIIIYKKLIRLPIISSQGHPVFSRQRAHIRYGFLPHLVGGNDIVKSLLFSPYPAIPPYVVRTPHPGMTDDREHISRQHSRAWTEREREREKKRERKKGERGRVWGPSRQLVVIPTTGALIAGNPPTQDSHHMPRNHSADNLIDT